MRFAALSAIGGPESGGLEPEQVLAGDVTGLDAEDAAAGECLADHREHAAFLAVVQAEGFTHGGQCIVGAEQAVDGVPVEQEEAGFSAHRCTPSPERPPDAGRRSPSRGGIRGSLRS